MSKKRFYLSLAACFVIPAASILVHWCRSKPEETNYPLKWYTPSNGVKHFPKFPEKTNNVKP